MPSISNSAATYAFITLRGQVQPLRLMVEDITRPGVNGHAFREMARHGDPFELTGVTDVNSLADAKTAFDAMVSAWSGRLVNVVDDLGATHANLMCLNVERVESFKLLRAVGGVSNDKGAMLIVRVTLQSTT